MKLVSRWITRELVGRSGGMLVFWSEQVNVQLMACNDFSRELLVGTMDDQESFWITFVYASTDARLRQNQWGFFIKRK